MEPNQNESESAGISPCAQCGQEFVQPLLAELRLGNEVREYQACPRCLSKVRGIEHESGIEISTIAVDEPQVEETPKIETRKTEEMLGCPYYVGYLRKRPKGDPIPEGCLVCIKMIGCI